MSLIQFPDKLILDALSTTEAKTVLEVAQAVQIPTKRGSTRHIATGTARHRLERLRKAGKTIKTEWSYGRNGCKWLRAE